MVQNHAADQLHVEVPHSEDPFAGLPDNGKSLGKQIVELFALGEAFAEGNGLAAQFLVGEGGELLFKGVDACNTRLHPLDVALVLASDYFFNQRIDHYELRGMIRRCGKSVIATASDRPPSKVGILAQCPHPHKAKAAAKGRRQA
jgi:hypothetical protein